MSDAAAPSTTAASPKVKSPKKKTTKPKSPASHPKYSQMVKAAIVALKERGGSSRQAILHYIIRNYKVADEKTVNQHLKMALRAGVKNNSLKQSKGTGASGSFRLGETKAAKPRKPVVKKAKKPKVVKPKKAKKPTKSPKKPKTAKPKKPKTAAAKKTSKKTAKPKTTKAVKPKAKKTKTPKKVAKAKK